jgi:hypothetical protein
MAGRDQADVDAGAQILRQLDGAAEAEHVR